MVAFINTIVLQINNDSFVFGRKMRNPWRKISKETHCITRFQDLDMGFAAFFRDGVRFAVFLLR